MTTYYNVVYNTEISHNQRSERIFANSVIFHEKLQCFVFYEGSDQDYDEYPTDNLIKIVSRNHLVSIEPAG